MLIYVDLWRLTFNYVDLCRLHPFPTEIQNLCTFSIILRVVFKMWVKSSIPLNCSTLLDIARRFLTVCSTLLDMARRFLTVCSTWLDMARRCSTWLDVARSPNFSGMLFLLLFEKQPLEWSNAYTKSWFLWETDAICINRHKST